MYFDCGLYIILFIFLYINLNMFKLLLNYDSGQKFPGAQIPENKLPKKRTFFGNFGRYLSCPAFTWGILFSTWRF